jgi:hypothetical protein
MSTPKRVAFNVKIMPRRQKNIKNKILNIKNNETETDDQVIKKNGKINLKVRIKKEKKREKFVAVKVAEEKRDVSKKEKVKKAVDPEKEERDKRMIMWLGIAFFMVLIIGFWFYNINSIFRTSNLADKQVSDFDWEKIKNEFKKATDEVKKNMAEIKKIQAPELQNTLPNSENGTEQNEINLLKQRLLEAASSTIATSTVK